MSDYIEKCAKALYESDCRFDGVDPKGRPVTDETPVQWEDLPAVYQEKNRSGVRAVLEAGRLSECPEAAVGALRAFRKHHAGAGGHDAILAALRAAEDAVLGKEKP